MKPIVPTTALDPQALSGLKRAARDGRPSEETLKQVASQFEALFMQMMLKSMREASLGDELFDGEQTEFYRDLYDQQLSVTLAKAQGLGLSDMLVRQLGGHPAGGQGAGTALDAVLQGERARLDVRAGRSVHGGGDPQNFVRGLWPQAERVAAALNVAPEAIVAVAALETGWGGSVPRRADGSSTNNLFGIKADERWGGERVTAATREVIDGRSVLRRESFRAYATVAEGVEDFANFLRSNPRYAQALEQGRDPRAFVRKLAASGYATDPAYAGKLEGLLGGETLRQALAGLKISGDRPIPA